MMLTKGAIGNLINRYSAVLKKCSLINTFGSLAVAGMLVMGGVSGAVAGVTAKSSHMATTEEIISGEYDGDTGSGAQAGAVTVDYGVTGVTIANDTQFTNNTTTGTSAGALKLLNGVTIGNSVEFSKWSKSNIANPLPSFRFSFLRLVKVPQNVTAGKLFFNTFFLSASNSERKSLIIFSCLPFCILSK